MKAIQKPARGNNPALPEFADTHRLRLLVFRKRYGIGEPIARTLCDLALGYTHEGGEHD